MYDAAVFIGRFQPFHNGHWTVIKNGLQIAKEVIVVVGSASTARNIRNPFTFAERKQMIRSVFTAEEVERIKIVGVSDYPYDENKWVAAVQTAVMGALKFNPGPVSLTLIGHSKDHTSYYLKMFPFWDTYEVQNYANISATMIREAMLGDNEENIDVAKFMNPEVRKYIAKLISNGLDGYADFWLTLRQEYRMVKQYKESWKAAPFPPTFVTVDAVVVQSGHVLLVKRKAMPGAGLWALPGGFLDQEETLLDGAIRELKEETKIKVPVPVLRGSIKKQHTFDAPNRSLRGRTITTAFYIDLGFSETLPKVTGADDAEKAKWVAFKDINRSEMFEDHFSIIDYFTNIG